VLAVRPDLPPEIQAIVERALAKSPLDRYQSAGAIVGDLKAALAGATISRPDARTAPIDMSTIGLGGEVFTPPPPPAAPPPQMPREVVFAPPPFAPPPSAGYRRTFAPAVTGPVPRRRRKMPVFMLLGGFVTALVCLALVVVGYAVWSGGLGDLEWLFSVVATPTAILASPPGSPPASPPADTPAPGPTETPTLTPSPTLIPTSTIEPVQVSPLCAYYGHPIVYVEAGRPVMLAWTWNAKTKELSQEHIDTATYRILLDGVEVQAVRRGEIEYDTAKGWFSVTWYAEPMMLEVGTHLAERYLSWSRQISDGWSSYGPGTSKETPHDDCTIIVR
jgi:eukaryotic-like serine/threonine-protein kinase